MPADPALPVKFDCTGDRPALHHGSNRGLGRGEKRETEIEEKREKERERATGKEKREGRGEREREGKTETQKQKGTREKETKGKRKRGNGHLNSIFLFPLPLPSSGWAQLYINKTSIATMALNGAPAVYNATFTFDARALPNNQNVEVRKR
jgi:hypothetical protein